jgi:hypothetical protein
MMTMVISGSDGVTFPDSTNQFSGGAFSFKNRIINGDMRIDQRNAGASLSYPSSTYANCLDRWQGQNSNDGAFTIQQVSDAPTGFVNSLKFTTTTADASLAATQQAWIRQPIEGLNVPDLAWGTASAKTVTLSFWVRSSLTGTFGGAITNNAENRSYPFTYSISAADTWEYKTITIAGDTSGTWLTTNSRGVILILGLGVGSTYSGTAGAWAGATYLTATGAVSVIGTLNATWYITGVQLEVGSVATPFERRPFGTELALCQRYCYAQNKLVTNSYYAFGTGFATSITTGQLATPFPVSMRANPSATYSAANLFFVDAAVSTSNGFTVIQQDQVGNNFGYSSFTGGTGATSGYSGRWLANAGDAAWIIWSAEL